MNKETKEGLSGRGVVYMKAVAFYFFASLPPQIVGRGGRWAGINQLQTNSPGKRSYGLTGPALNE